MAHCVAPDPEVIKHAVRQYRRLYGTTHKQAHSRVMESVGPLRSIRSGEASASAAPSWHEYLQAIGIAQHHHGARDCASHPNRAIESIRSALNVARSAESGGAESASGAPSMVSQPVRPVSGTVHAIVLLVDFPDLPGSRPQNEYQQLFFGLGQGSVRHYYDDVSGGAVKLVGTVSQWLRMPHNYSYYVNGASGTGDDVEHSSRGLARAAISVARANSVVFAPELAGPTGTVDALVLVHSGIGAELLSDEAARLNNMWSHKWQMPTPVAVGDRLTALTYLVVPQRCKLGVCAHELGHLLFDWEDFYDPNYDEDGESWDGSGSWDLMAGGSYNGGEERPAHPAALHKLQHKWVSITTVTRTTRAVKLSPNDKRVVVVESAAYRPGKQFLVLECRSRTKSNSYYEGGLPGSGLLVWRVDLARHMNSPTAPAMTLIQADGLKHLDDDTDGNSGDAGDPFPGSTGRRSLSDDSLHLLNTNFPEMGRSGVEIKNIVENQQSGAVSFDIVITNPMRSPGAAPISEHVAALIDLVKEKSAAATFANADDNDERDHDDSNTGNSTDDERTLRSLAKKLREALEIATNIEKST